MGKVSIVFPNPNLILSSSFPKRDIIPDPPYINEITSIISLGLISGDGYESGIGGLLRKVLFIVL